MEVRSEGRSVAFEAADGIIEFDTEPNGLYVIHGRPAAPGGTAEESSPPLGAPRAADGQYGPLCYTGPAFVGDVPPEGRVGVWLGLPPKWRPEEAQATAF